MTDPILDQPAYVEILIAIRQHLSLARVAQYLGSKPQNISGWLNAKSVPTLKDFRERLLEVAFFLKYIAEVHLDLGPTATALIEARSPLLPPWGVTLSGATDQPKIVVADIENPLERWSHQVVNNVRDFLPRSHQATAPTRLPVLSLPKLALLKQLYDIDNATPKRGKAASAPKQNSPILVWGEGCSGKSTFVNSLLGAEIFPVTVTPESPRLHELASDTNTVVEVPSFDGAPPTPPEVLRLLRYLIVGPDCRLFVILSSQSLATIARQNILADLALLPCKMTLVFSKIDLYGKSEEVEQVERFLRARFAAYHVVIPQNLKLEDPLLSELRNAAELVGTRRLKLIASAHTVVSEPLVGDDLFGALATVVRSVLKSETPLTPDTRLSDLGLSEVQMGQLLLAIETKLGVLLSDRDTDSALRGKETLGWLATVALPRTEHKSA